MPRRQISETNLRIGAHLAGWILAGWSALMTTVMVLYTDHATLGIELRELGMPHWLIGAPMLTLTAMQLAGHFNKSRSLLVAASLLGAFLCLMGAAVIGYATLRGADSAGEVVNWAFVGCLFLLDFSIMRQPQQ